MRIVLALHTKEFIINSISQSEITISANFFAKLFHQLSFNSFYGN